ncbi:hypothetical protein ACQ4LE_008987 [Meloidogyne hapla]|uniref:Haloacid dehalogenase-like hydrolase domain-containing protein n=1 Tax=Meloidogyne hapla TaxID=6305 RepID=A0A1I8BNL3_MELHA
MSRIFRLPFLLATGGSVGASIVLAVKGSYSGFEIKQTTGGGGNNSKLKKVKSVIFDFDGIIVDSETIFYKANAEACEHFGGEYTLEIKHAQMGRNLSDAVECVLRRTGLTEKKVTEKEYLEVYNKSLDKLLPDMKLMPGARRLTEHLQKNGVQTSICTSSSSDEFSKKIEKCGDLVKKMNTVVLAGDDPEVEVGKPGPEPYLVTMRRMDPKPLNPTEVLVFEDSINGVKSALSAGCTVIWVPQQDSIITNWGGQEATERKFKRYSNFAEMIPSLNKFEPEKYGLPPYSLFK